MGDSVDLLAMQPILLPSMAEEYQEPDTSDVVLIANNCQEEQLPAFAVCTENYQDTRQFQTFTELQNNDVLNHVGQRILEKHTQKEVSVFIHPNTEQETLNSFPLLSSIEVQSDLNQQSKEDVSLTFPKGYKEFEPLTEKENDMEQNANDIPSKPEVENKTSEHLGDVEIEDECSVTRLENGQGSALINMPPTPEEQSDDKLMKVEPENGNETEEEWNLNIFLESDKGLDHIVNDVEMKSDFSDNHDGENTEINETLSADSIPETGKSTVDVETGKEHVKKYKTIPVVPIADSETDINDSCKIIQMKKLSVTVRVCIILCLV